MTWGKVLILCSLVLLFRVPYLTHNQCPLEVIANSPVISNGSSITNTETKGIITDTLCNFVYAWKQIISSLRTAFHNHIQKDEELVTRTDNAVQRIVNYLSP